MDVFKRAYEAQPGRIAPHLDPSNMFTHKNDLFNPDGTPKYDTDWQDAVTRTAFLISIHLVSLEEAIS
ncbi:hypothetical protein HMPREF1002_05067 [Porphyromonas sp. 31_2]|nr:hypothetical protein HMPREF1002_05067 [Porphyromonas sp. 31_2]